MAVAAFLISGMSASNAMAVSSTGQANANVILPITITPGDDLRFGTGQPGETLIILKDGTTTNNGSALAVSVQGVFGRASFSVGGETSQTFTVTPDATVTLGTLTNAASLACDLSGTVPQDIYCGGTLLLDPLDTPGPHSGSFNVSVDYP